MIKTKRKFFGWFVAGVAVVIALFSAVGIILSNTKSNAFMDGVEVSGGYGDPTADTTPVQSIVIEDTTFVGDSTFVKVISGENVTLENCTFEGKTVGAAFDYIRVEGGELNLKNSTISGASESNFAGTGVYASGGVINVEDTVIEKLDKGIYASCTPDNYDYETDTEIPGTVSLFNLNGKTEIVNNNTGLKEDAYSGQSENGVQFNGNILLAGNSIAVDGCFLADDEFEGLLADNDQVFTDTYMC